MSCTACSERSQQLALRAPALAPMGPCRSAAPQEPLLEAIELLQHTDVMIGMHGAGWTNGMFIKHGAVTLQMFPYGWRLPDNSTIRGWGAQTGPAPVAARGRGRFGRSHSVEPEPRRLLAHAAPGAGLGMPAFALGVRLRPEPLFSVTHSTPPRPTPPHPPLTGITTARLCWPRSATTPSGSANAGTTPSSAASTSTVASSERGGVAARSAARMQPSAGGLLGLQSATRGGSCRPPWALMRNVCSAALPSNPRAPPAGCRMEYVLHPDPHGPHPVDGWPGNPWVYQVGVGVGGLGEGAPACLPGTGCHGGCLRVRASLAGGLLSNVGSNASTAPAFLLLRRLAPCRTRTWTWSTLGRTLMRQ